MYYNTHYNIQLHDDDDDDDDVQKKKISLIDLMDE